MTYNNMISFDDINAAMTPHSMVPHDRKVALYRSLTSIQESGLTGAAAELGVYRGGTALMIASILSGKDIFLFDTFTGIPYKGEHDKHSKGDFADTSGEAVMEVLAGCKDRIRLCEGLFPDTAAMAPPDQKYAFVHCDADQYESTKSFLEYFYPRMTRGGVMVFDDYQWEPCPGVEKALKEFLPGKPEVIYIFAEYQAMIFKC